MTQLKCPECGSNNIDYEDNSFDHEFGTKEERIYFCNDCDWSEFASEIE